MWMTLRGNVLFRGAVVDKRGIDSMMYVATKLWKMEDLILLKFGQHIETTDWIIGVTVYARHEGISTINQISTWLAMGFQANEMAIMRGIMNAVARVPQNNAFCAMGWASKSPPPICRDEEYGMPSAEESAAAAKMDTSTGDISTGPGTRTFRDGSFPALEP